ncbi:MAG TPA: PASTA domain-containing protein [Mycobacteriales bacterium]|nr:PASTA domain-containing protein [Mycobacteriales bacterium]
MRAALNNPLDGTVFDGRYRLDGVLARGGMSTVYTGTDLRLDRTVAIKVMADSLIDDPVFVRRFSQEARAAARLSHPNVVAVYDQGSDGGHAYLVMELVVGHTLRDLLRERGRLPPELATSILVPVLAALSAAHRAGLVHRDIKPENILLAENADADTAAVKVADFGLARAIASASTTSAAALGTVSYAAPEQVSNGTTDPRTDVYSAGIVLYEMLTGSPPYVAENAISVAYRHVHDDVPPPSERLPGLPEELDAITVRATRREPAARPVDAGAFLAELRDVRDDLGLRMMPLPTGIRRVADQGRRNATGTLFLDDQPTGRDAGPAGQPLPVPPPPVRRLPPEPEYRPPQPPRRDPEQRQHRRRFLLAVLLVVLLGAAVAVAGWWFGSGRYTSVPKLSMLTVTEARATARSAHIKIDLLPDRQHSEDVPAGAVITSKPGNGAKVLRGSDIELQLSSGPERYVIPRGLVGHSKGVVQQKLGSLPLSVQFSESYSSTVQDGRVVRVSPGAGTSMRRGQSVSVVVSNGPAPFDVPEVGGASQGDATTTLQNAGLKVAVTQEFSDTVQQGLVISQEPSSGQVGRGDTVRLTVSKGPELIQVPDVTRMSVKQATRELRAKGFKVQVQDFFAVLNQVVQTKPAAGTMVPKGSTIQVIGV